MSKIDVEIRYEDNPHGRLYYLVGLIDIDHVKTERFRQAVLERDIISIRKDIDNINRYKRYDQFDEE